MKVDILAFAAHPDDVELSCSGTLLKHIKMGKSVVVIDLTRGELGTRGNAAIRAQEAAKSAKIMGLSARENLELADGFFDRDQETLKKLVYSIRKYQPDIVLCNALDDRHPDHGRAAKIEADACFLSGLVKVETLDEKGEKQLPWRPDAFYHYIQDNLIQKPDFVIDITEVIDQKMEAIMAFSSQFYNPDSNEPMTPIAGKQFLDYLLARSKTLGRWIQVEHAEGFHVPKVPGIRSLYDLF